MGWGGERGMGVKGRGGGRGQQLVLNNWVSTGKRAMLDLYLMPRTKINFE